MPYLSAAAAVTSQDKWDCLDDYLVLGTDIRTYYAGGRELSPAHAGLVRECLAEDGERVVNAIVECARAGRAPRTGPALLALAMACSPRYAPRAANAAALEALPRVVLTTSHLQEFVGFATAVRGWGRGLRSAVARWYLEQPPRELVRSMLKHRRRGRWAHADLLRLAHPKPAGAAQRALFRWAVEGEVGSLPEELRTGDLKLLWGYELARHASNRRAIVDLIEQYGLTHQMIPGEWKRSPEVWEALVDSMPYAALLRHLSQLAAVGLIARQGEMTALVAARLVDRNRISRAKVSPVTLLHTLLEYRQRHAVPAIAAALEEALYLSLESAAPTGGCLAVTLDAAAPIASAVVGMLAARARPTATIAPAIEKQDRVDAVLAAVAASGGQPVCEPRGAADDFVIVSGDGNSHTAADLLRRLPISARVVLIAANSKQPPIPEARDPRLLQVVGFDAHVPALLAGFLRRE